MQGLSYAKAVVSALVCAAAYLGGVLPAEGSLGDVSTAQWLGLVVAVGSAFGLTYTVPNTGKALDQHGDVGLLEALLIVLVVIVILVLLGALR